MNLKDLMDISDDKEFDHAHRSLSNEDRQHMFQDASREVFETFYIRYITILNTLGRCETCTQKDKFGQYKNAKPNLECIYKKRDCGC
jgi:hypothetical protein